MKHSITRKAVPRATFVAVDKLIQQYETKLHAYVERLIWWNERVNLVSRNVSRETIFEHIRHSLLLTRLEAYQRADLTVDAGTGGGLPGIPLAIASPEKRFVLNDIVSKKIMAIKQIARSLKLQNISFEAQSIGDVNITDTCLLISKHAFKIDELYALSANLPWSQMVFYKGVEFADELKSIKSALKITIYTLSENSKIKFYKDKALVVIKKNRDQ